jgi:4-diphosphocytidyl-2-C-methyl-D-erythritol kinase
VNEGPTRLLAPAKLTLSLRVVGVRPDGFHELSAEMVSIDLADELVVDPARDGLEIELDGVEGPLQAGDTNLVRRALDEVGRRAHVRLRKRIPVGGGLGGGSSDAAAVLRWAGVRDPERAARLGADVPFCLVGGRALVEGIGERVTPMRDRPQRFVLLVPPVAVDTATVYRAYDRLDPAERQVGGGANDLLAAALSVEPELARWRDRLGELTGALPRLAGSGATWFVEGAPGELGLDPDRDRVELEGRTGRLIAVRTLGPAS